MMSLSRHILSSIAAMGVLVATSLVPAHAGSYGSTTSQADIVDTAVAAGQFNTLVTAVEAAGLVETLKGEGPFTVFAPTDEAFAKIPQAQLEALLANKEALTAVLTYHVLPGRITSGQLLEQRLITVDTVQGESVTVDARNGVRVNDANVVKADISASNGVIHVIDTVILPPSVVSSLEMEMRVAALEIAR